jgi:hypothetical protein
MKRLEFDENTKLADILRKIQQDQEPEIEILIPPQVPLLKLGLNKEIIRSVGQASGKKIIFKDELVAKKLEAAAGTTAATGAASENLGFVEGKDIAHETEAQPLPTEEPLPVTKKRFSFPKIPFSKIIKGPKWLYFLAGFIILLIIGGIFLFWSVPSATVTLITEKQFKDAELTLVASSTADKVDADKGIIPMKILDTDQEDTGEAKATGTKTIGTPAKGRVSIVNRDTAEKKYFAGTVITPTSGTALQFTLDTAATISASQLGCGANPSPPCSQSAVDVTAKTIGEESNLAAGTVFKVGNADVNLVFAVSGTNFTGGTSKKVTVISADDQKKAKEDLIKKMEEKAKKDLEEKNHGIVIADGGLENTVTEEVYSNKVDEEAADFQVSLKVKFTAKVFAEKDLKNLLIKSISDSIPAGYSIDQDHSVVSGEVLEKLGDDLKVLGKIKAELSPNIPTDEIKRNLAGKNFNATDSYLKSLGYEFEVKVNPAFFRIFGNMPFSNNRIEIKVSQKE